MFLTEEQYNRILSLLDKRIASDYIQQKKLMDGANYDKAIQKAYAEKFAELARKYDMHPEYHKAEDIG